MKFKKSRSIQVGFAALVFTFLFQLPLSAEDKNCLWRVETETNSVYFLGSIHMLKKECYPLKSAINDAYDTAQVVVFEINIDSSQSSHIQQKIMVEAMSKDGKTLKDKLNSETYERASQKMQEAGVNIEQFNMFEPWFLSISLMALKIKKLGFNPVYGLDYHFFNKAKKDGKQVMSLETIDFQIDLFNELNFKDKEAIVQQTLDELNLLEEQLQKLIDSWIKGDTKQLEFMVLESFKSYPHIYNTFLIQRNKKWIDKIESLLKADKNCLIIAGTAHLLGDKGVLSLLQEKGYVVEQL